MTVEGDEENAHFVGSFQMFNPLLLYPEIYIYKFNNQAMDSSTDLSRFGACFAQNYNSPNIINLISVFGHSKAGKSVSIDLLANKQLILYEEVQIKAYIVVERNNCAAEYPSIYIAKGENSTLLLEGFNIDQEIQSKKIQVLKLIFLRHFVEQAERAAFLLLIEEGQKDEIVYHIERLLKFIGMNETKRDARIDIIKDCLFLMITKAEEDFESIQGIFQELANDCDNENVQEIIRFLLEKKRIEQFRVEAPSYDFIKSIKDKFQPKPLGNHKRELLNLLDKSTLNNETEVFSKEDQQYTRDILLQTTKMIGLLLLFASSGDRNDQRQYQVLAKKLYPDHKRKIETDTMLGKVNKNQVAKVNPSARLTEVKTKDVSLDNLIKVVIKIIDDMQVYSQAKGDYEEIKGRLIFFQNITYWFQACSLRENTAEIYQFLTKTLQSVVKNTGSPEKAKPQAPVAPAAKPKPSARQSSKKGNKQFNAFKALIQDKCTNNKEAIDICLQTIKEKEKEQKYEYFQVIYCIRLLKDLFEQYDFKVPSDCHLFIKELMELALYSQSYFDLERYLPRAIRSKALTSKDAKSLMIALKNCGRYETCQRVADYILSECSQSAIFNKMAQFKTNLKLLINKEYFDKPEDGQNKPEVKKKELSFSMQDLIAKSKGTRLDTFFAGKHFEQYLGNRE